MRDITIAASTRVGRQQREVPAAYRTKRPKVPLVERQDAASGEPMGDHDSAQISEARSEVVVLPRQVEDNTMLLGV